MRPFAAFRMTISFVWMKFLLCLLAITVDTVLFAIMVGLSFLASPILGWFMFVIWLALASFLTWQFYRRFMYLTEAGHIAVLTQVITTGKVHTEDMVYEGRQAAKHRFRTSKNYFSFRRMIHRCIGQLQRYFETITDENNDVPGMKTLISLGKFLEHLTLHYIADACLSYVCWCYDLSVSVAAKEAIGVYAYNWNRLTEKAGETATAVVSLFIIVATAAAFGMSTLFGVMKLSQYLFFAVILAIAIVYSIKYAFLDSYLSARAIFHTLGSAQDTVLSEDLYAKLAAVSVTFRRLVVRSKSPAKRKVAPTKAQNCMSAQNSAPAQRKPPAVQHAATRICPNCGVENDSTNRSCVHCHLALR